MRRSAICSSAAVTSTARVLGDVMDAWSTGRRVDHGEELRRADEDDRAALADALMLWLAVAPDPMFDADGREALRSDPVVARLHEAIETDSGLLGLELMRSRTGAGLEPAELAAAVGVDGALEALEAETLPAELVPTELLDALAGALDVSGPALRAAAGLSRSSFVATSAGGRLFRPDPDAAWCVEEDLTALAAAARSPAPARAD